MGRVTLWLGDAKVSHHPTTFGGRRHCGIVDIIVLVYHSLELGAFQNKLSSYQVWWP